MENEFNQYNEENNLNEVNEPVQTMEYNDVPYQDAPPVPMVSFGGLPPAIEAIKSAAKSKSFLIATICFTISTLISLISLVVSGALTGEMLGLVMTEMDAYAQTMMETTVTATLALVFIVGIVPMLLMLIGMWVIYGSGRKNTPYIKGLGACRATLIIWDVLMWIVFVYTVIIGVVLIAVSGLIGEELSYYAYDDVKGIVVGVVIGIAVFLIVYVLLALIYVTKMLKTTRAVKDIVAYGFSKKKVSVYVIVINFFLVAGGVLSILLGAAASAFVSFLPEMLYELGISGAEINAIMSGVSALTGATMTANMIPQVLSIITIICINIVLINLRKKLKQIFAY